MGEEFKIEIVSAADNTGFKSAGDAAVETSRKIKISGDDLNETTKRELGLLPEVVSGQNLVGEATKHAGEAAEEAGLSHRELRKVLFEIGNTAAPGAGHALSELAFGPVGAALALVSAFEMVKKAIEEDEKEMDAIAERAAQPMGGGVVQLEEAWNNAAIALGKYYSAMRTGGEEADPIKKQIEDAKELLLVRLEGEKKIAEAMGDTAKVAALNAALDRTKGTSSLLEEQGLREKAAKKLNDDAVQANADAERAKNQFKNDQAELKKGNDALGLGEQGKEDPAFKAAEKAKEEAAQKLEAAQNLPDSTSVTVGTSTQIIDNREAKAKQIAEAQAEVEKVHAQEEATRKRRDQLKESEVARTDVVTTTETEAKRKEKESVDNNSRLKQLPGQIDRASESENLREHTDKVVEVLNTHGGQQGLTLSKLAEATGKTHAQTEKIVGLIVSGHLRLQAAFAQMEQQLKNIPSHTR